MSDIPVELSEEETRRLDAACESPPAFERWQDARVAEELWAQWLSILEDHREAAAPGAFDTMREQVMRQAAIETGAIEGLYETDRGFTFSVAGMASGWEAAIEREKGIDVARLVEGQMEAYEMALDVATDRQEMSEALIQQLHELACAGQDTYDVITPVGPQKHPLAKGAYKEHPNHVRQPDGSTHSYAPVDRTSDEMHRFVEELRSPAFEEAHPAVQAAFAHYTFAAIHPFSDGNGRVARLVASIYLMRAASVPLVLFADERPAYLDALRAADSGAVDVFARFVCDRTVDTMMYLVEELRRASHARSSEALRALGAAMLGPGGLSHHEVDSVAERLREVLRTEIGAYVEGLALPPGVVAQPGTAHGDHNVPEGTRLVIHGNTGMPVLTFQAPEPASAATQAQFDVLVSKNDEDPFALRVQHFGSDEVLPVRLEEVYPEPQTRLVGRLRPWVARHVDRALEELAVIVAERLRNAGYR